MTNLPNKSGLTEEITAKAAALGFTFERGTHRGAGYQLTNKEGEAVLGDGHTAGLKEVNKFLDQHIKQKAEAVGVQLTTQKRVTGLHELSSGETRAATVSVVGYKLEKRDVILDQGRREDDRKTREERLRSGGRIVEWVTVLGIDYTATLPEVIAYLDQRADDIGIDADDLERDDKKKKIAPPSLQKMAASIRGHDNTAEIARIGYGNKEIDRRPRGEEIRVRDALAAMTILSGSAKSAAFHKLTPAERQEWWRRKEKLEREYEEIQRLKGNYDKVKIDPFEQERRRQRNKFLEAEKKLCWTSTASRMQVDEHGDRPGLDLELDWRDRNVRPDPHAAPVFGAASQDFAVTTKEQIDRRDHDAVPASSLAGLKQAAAERRLAQIGPEAKAAIEARDFEKAAALLTEAQTKLAHGQWLPWLEKAGIDKQAAQRCLRRVKSVT